MINRNVLHLNRIFCLALLIAVPASGAITPTLAASQPRAGGAQLVAWHSLFPLDAGYRWVYAVQGPGSMSRTLEVKVTGEQSPALFRTYFDLSGYFPGKDPRLVRTTIFGTVLERGDDGKDYLWYEFSGRVGRTWTMDQAPGDSPTCEDGAELKIGARDETVKVPAGEFRQVVRIEYATKCFDAGITREWFAPGVGLIRREQQSIAGPIISELVYAELGDKVIPAAVYSTTLQLSASLYAYNLMPPVDTSKFPRVNGTFVVRDKTDDPSVLFFPDGCQPLLLEVRNRAGEVVRSITFPEHVLCPQVMSARYLGKEALVIPFSFTLADESGKALPDGAYSITAVLQAAAEHDSLRPAARAVIEAKSTQ